MTPFTTTTPTPAVAPPLCPKCGSTLAATAAPPTTPPWHCAECRWCWWNAQTTATARAAFRPTRWDFRPATAVREAVLNEARIAHQRGTSIFAPQVHLVTPAQAQGALHAHVIPPIADLLAKRAKGASL